MEDSPKPTRRWFRFSLRTMLVLVTLACINLGWAVNWIRQREAFLKPDMLIIDLDTDCPASILVRIVGARGFDFLQLIDTTDQKLEKAKRLGQSKYDLAK